MANNPSNPAHRDETQRQSRLSQLAWVPVPLLALTIAGLWTVHLRTAYESRVVMVLLNLVFTWLASLCICVLTARGFLGTGQPGLLMFGCGSLLWGITSLAAAVVVDRVNPTITIHNLGVFGAALCHLVGLIWFGRLRRPGRWLVVGYACALMTSAVIIWAALTGSLPVFFVQGQGGTLVREVVLLLAVAMFTWVAWRLIDKFRRQAGAYYYWYGLGLALVATGLTGVLLLSVQGGIMGWTNRLTQYLGSAYLFVAAFMAARETGSWTFSLAPAEEPGRQQTLVAGLRQQSSLRWAMRYGLAIGVVAAAMGFRQALTEWAGPGLPPYITLYPAVMAVAVLGGFGPGLSATLLGGLLAAYWNLPPVGFPVESPVDRIGLVIFIGMGLFMSAVAELYRRHRHKAAAYDREAALRESQARLATFAAATFEGIIESEAGRIVDCNEQAERMLGYTLAELRGMEIANLVAPEDRERVAENIRQGRLSSIEHAILRKDGTRITVEAHGQPLFPDSATRLTALRDLTDRKRAEQALRENEVRYRTLFNTIDAGFCVIQMIFDAQGKPADYRFLEVNTAFERQTGLHEAQGKLMRELAPAHEAHWFETYGAIAMTGEARHFVNEARQLNRWYDVYAYRVGAPEARQVAILFNDVTTQRQAEQDLRQKEAELQRAQRAARLGSWYWNAKTDVTTGSEELLRIFGFDPATQGMPDFKAQRGRCYPVEDWERVNAAVQETVRTGVGYELDVRAFRNGATIWITTRGEVVRHAEGAVVGLRGTVQDITARKQTEEALRASNQELSQFNQAMVGRELRMIELKKEVNALCAELRQPPRYEP